MIKQISVFALLLNCLGAGPGRAQTGAAMVVDVSALEGVDLSPDNAYEFRVTNPTGGARAVELSGSLRYRSSRLWATWKLRATLQPGLNVFSKGSLPSAPVWQFSEAALRELFMDYRRLPQGTYEYCVTVRPEGVNGEIIPGEESDGCVYRTVEDLFAINLIMPEDDAKIYEHNPQFSWVVNYPFASALTYRIRVAEQKKGQNPQNAITRNNPVCQDSRVQATTTVYPVTGRPLALWQPYVWTVDAYYKGILLGGAEAWRFTIVEDSELVALPRESNYVDIRMEEGRAIYNAVGLVKMKYVLKDKAADQLTMQLFDKAGKEIPLRNKTQGLRLGDNRWEVDLTEQVQLVHLGKYTLTITNGAGTAHRLHIRYINPLFVK